MQSLNDLIDLAQPVFDCVGFFCVKNTYACEGINDKKNYFLLCVAMMMSLRACPREHRAVVLHTISPISVKLCQFKGSTPKLKKTKWFLFWFFPGGDRPPSPVFLGFHKGNRLKIGKMYEALTAMVFNQLL